MLKAMSCRLSLIAIVLFSPMISAGETIEISHAWIREAPPTSRMLAGYMQITNLSDKPQLLLEAKSEQLGHIMFHSTVVRDGVARMIHMDKVKVPAKGSISFEPGGRHLMIGAPEGGLKAGQHVEVDLIFRGGLRERVEFTVKKAQEMNEGDMHHHH